MSSYQGYAALVPLDYGQTSLGRLEHSIITQPFHWASMVKLIQSPQNFMNQARSSYLYDSAQVAKDLKWQFRGPMTIVIEPLTSLTQANIETLTLLSQVYPALNPNVLPFETISPMAFRQFVTQGAKNSIEKLSKELAQRKIPERTKDQAKIEYRPQPRDSRDDLLDERLRAPLSSSKGFPGLYVAEFAANTRLLIIRYIPPEFPPALFYSGRVTPLTMSKIQNTGISFAHFDLYLSKKGTDFEQPTQLNASWARAQYAVDYLADVSRMDALVKGKVVNDDVKVPTTDDNYRWSQGNLKLNNDQLDMQKTLPLKACPTFKANRFCKDPTVVIESVWPSPYDAPEDESSTHVCIVVVGIDGTPTCWTNTNPPVQVPCEYQVGTTGIKGYMPPIPTNVVGQDPNKNQSG
ncbi:MAG: hypothetical protein ABL949_04000 [Fimbriimonadaceae bacterium]